MVNWNTIRKVKRGLLNQSLKGRPKDFISLMVFFVEIYQAWSDIFRHKSITAFVIHQATRDERWDRRLIFRYYLKRAVELGADRGNDFEQIALMDLKYGFEGDPASAGIEERLLWLISHKGFFVVQIQRMLHMLWLSNEPNLQHVALRISQKLARRYSVEIHPGAKLGSEFWIDHAHNVVIGETAIIGEKGDDDNLGKVQRAHVWMLHGVTLGGQGDTVDDRRHPWIHPEVMIGAGAKIIGPHDIGKQNGAQVELDDSGFATRIGAGALVRDSVRRGETFISPKARQAGMVGKTLGPIRPEDAEEVV